MKTMYSFSIAAITVNDKQKPEVRSPMWVSRGHNPSVSWLSPILEALGKNRSLARSGVGITHFLEVE